MNTKVYLIAKNGRYSANGIFTDGKLFVLKGSKIRLDFATHIRGGRTSKGFRENKEYVDSDGNVLKDCMFTSPSTAAQFVTGCSTNGYEAWYVDINESLGQHLGRNKIKRANN